MNILWHGFDFHRHFIGVWRWRPLTRTSVTTISVIFSFLFLGAFVFLWWNDVSIFPGNSLLSSKKTPLPSSKKTPLPASKKTPLPSSKKTPRRPEFAFKCSEGKLTQTCPSNHPTKHNSTNPGHSSNITCPDYFRWIHEDLRPWKETGITRDMIGKAPKTVHFRLVIVNGKAYVENYRASFQTRDMFTLWGILQLVRWYPGRLPDLELMFNCNDRPAVQSTHFRGPNPGPPPLFSYCSDQWSLDIVFPDWSFWGWPEINIKPWTSVLKDIKHGNNKTKWKDRIPYAYWRGNPYVSPVRGDLLKCNVSDKGDWNTRLYIQDWVKESKNGYKQSNLGNQCTHRYKIYVEGWGWSVSEKYILACDSMTLLIRPRFFDFFTRGMVPLQHYWPIRDNRKCTSLKFAVEWGNNHTEKAEAIGKASSNFIQEDLKMDYVYDYMFHLLNEYAKLLRFKPTIPPDAIELCLETMECPANSIRKKFMVASMVKSPSETIPCTMPAPYDPPALQAFLERKANSTRQVEMWENTYWENLHKKQ